MAPNRLRGAVIVVVGVFGACASDTLPKEIGVFYQTPRQELIALVNGTASGMSSRAVDVGTARPVFFLNLPDVQISEVRIGTAIRGNGYSRVEAAIMPIEGRSGLYKLTPKADLPRGLCAIILSSGLFGADEIYSDVANVYPFTIH